MRLRKRRRDVKVVEVEHRPDPAPVRRFRKPFHMLHVPPQLRVAQHAGFRISRQFEKEGEGMAGPEVNRVVPIGHQFIQIPLHERPVVEPGEVVAGDGPVVALVPPFHPEQVRAADLEGRTIRQVQFRRRAARRRDSPAQFQTSIQNSGRIRSFHKVSAAGSRQAEGLSFA